MVFIFNFLFSFSFRNFLFEGIFGLGSEYQDSCDENNCMSLLTIQVFVIVLLKPFARFFAAIIFP
jgi:hypothetical protein